MIELWAYLIRNGKKKIEQCPASIKAEVMAVLEAN